MYSRSVSTPEHRIKDSASLIMICAGRGVAGGWARRQWGQGVSRGCYTCCSERCGAELGQRQAGWPGGPSGSASHRVRRVCPGTSGSVWRCFWFVTAWARELPASHSGDLPSISVSSSLMKIIGKSKWVNTRSVFRKVADMY